MARAEPGSVAGTRHDTTPLTWPCDDGLVLTIRFARSDDLLALPEIERRAGEVFRALSMNAVADDEPLSVQHLAEYQRAGRAWVAEDAGEVVGYLLLDVVAGAAHIEQVSIDPTHARRRIGSQLIEAAASWAAQVSGLPEHPCAARPPRPSRTGRGSPPARLDVVGTKSARF